MAPCPRCQAELAAPEAGEQLCPGCGGRLISRETAEIELARHVGLSRAELLEVAEAFGGQRLLCPGCRQQMRPLTLRSIPLDLCFGCGALWLDHGELVRLTGEPGREGPAPVAPEPASLEVPPESTPATGEPGVALVLRGDEAPSERALKPAFLAIGQTVIDLRQVLARRSGILASRVSAEAALRFLSALGDKSDAVVAIPLDDLVVARAFDAPFLEVTPDGINLRDHHGRGGALGFDEIDAVLLAELRIQQSNSQLIEERHARARGPDRVVLRHEVKAVNRSEPVLGLVARDNRVRIAAGRLQGFPSSEKPAALTRFATQLAARVRPAALHPATRSALEGATQLQRVRRLDELDRELCWLAWRSRQ